MDGFVRDLAFALRALRRAPLLCATAVMTLATGIGVSAGVFAVAYGVLLRPLPYADPDRLVIVESRWARDPAGDVGVPLPEVDEWRRRSRVFEHVAGVEEAEFTVRGAGDPRSARVAMVTDGFFDLLGLGAQQGHTGDVLGSNHAIALSDGFAGRLAGHREWRERGLTVGSGVFSVVAVMPRSFAYPSEEIDAWVSARSVPPIVFFRGDDQRRFRLIARLRPGVSLPQAQDDAARVARELNEGVPERRHRTASVGRFDGRVRGTAAESIVPFAAGATLVLLIACANASGLLVARAAARQREFAIRRALGGGTAEVLRSAMTETLAIALAGWAVGVWFAYLVVQAFLVFGERAIPNLSAVRIDALVILVSLSLAIVVAAVTGAAPAIRAIRARPGTVLQLTSERSGRRTGIARTTLVVTQIALAVVLLVAAGLLIRTVLGIVDAERGFDLKNRLAMRLMLTDTIRFNVVDRAPVVTQLLEQVRAIPGVTFAGVGSDLPPRDAQIQMTIRVVRDKGDETFGLTFASVSPGFLEALGARLLAGRLLEERDRTAAVPAVVVSESAARHLFPGSDPVGREWPATIPNPGGKQVKPIVVGVIRDVKYGGLDHDARAALFTTWERMAPSQSFLIVRAGADAQELVPAIRAAVQRVDPALAVHPIETLEEVVAGSMAGRRLRVQLAMTFAALSLVLAAVALWGAVAQSVLDRRHELAVRLALGSTGSGAVGVIVRGAAIMITTGVAAGVVCAVLSARGLRHMLHGVTPLDPLSFGAGAVTAVVVSVLAAYLPARRAASINPAELLRQG